MKPDNSNIQADLWYRIDLANGFQPLQIGLYRNRGLCSFPKRDNTIQIHAAKKPQNQGKNQNRSLLGTDYRLPLWRKKMCNDELAEYLKERGNKL